MNQVRIHGDPFGEDAAASLLRSFLRLCLGSGMRCCLSLSAVRPRSAGVDEREILMTDGVRGLSVGTLLPPPEVEMLLRAAGAWIASTAPVVVFVAPGDAADAARLVGLEWPRAAKVLVAAEEATPAELLDRVRAELRWAGTENPPHAMDERELMPWLSLPPVPADGPIVHVGGADLAEGTDLVVDAWLRHFAGQGRSLRLVLPGADPAFVGALQERLHDHGGAFEILRSPFEPRHVRDAVAIVQPWRRLCDPRVLVQALASGRPLCASRFSATASIVGRVGTCLPIGGSNVPGQPVKAPFAPQEAAILAALRQAVGDRAGAAALGARARQHVIEELTRDRPAAPPPRLQQGPGDKPVVVLEAPFFETSSSAELSIETARALLARGLVDVRLVPVAPFRSGLDPLRRRAPELEPLLCRDPGAADLWLSAGWPVRTGRPACRTWALRVDWEFGSLPVELTPHVSQDADVVVVHSEHVCRAVTAAGRPAERVKIVPHGVDAAMHEGAPPDPAIVAWKAGRPAVLFCGGLIWRKGFDAFLQTVLSARVAGADFCVVVKSVGHDQHYGRFHLGDLVQRYLATPGTPPLRLIEEDLTRERLASVYTACDLLLHPYRGEGFCLPILEARACGLPVLATAGGAADSLLVGPGASKIAAVRRPVDLPAAHLSPPWVLEPSAEQGGRLLVEALADIGERRREARAFAGAVRTSFSWEAAARSIEHIAFAARRGPRLPLVAPVEPVVTLPLTAAKPLPVGARVGG